MSTCKLTTITGNYIYVSETPTARENPKPRVSATIRGKLENKKLLTLDPCRLWGKC